MTLAIIVADNVSVELPIFEAHHRSLKHSFLGAAGAGRLDVARGHVIVQALRNVSLTARDGDRIALVGRNGAGKSTLLRTLAGLTEPNSGSVKIEGQISTLFNVGSFLDPNATGYENIQHAGRLLGLSSATIKELTPDIEEFTELGRYLALPVRTYSAGMSVRLAFSIATAIEPDILLLDEAITAGDSHFVSKAAKRAEDLYQRTSIMIIASHDTNILRRMCNKAVFLESGQIVASGDVDSVIEAYERHGATAVAIGGEKKRVISNSIGEIEGSPDAILDVGPDAYWRVNNTKDAWIGVDLAHPSTDMRPSVSSLIVRHGNAPGQPAPALYVEASDDFFVADTRIAGRVSPVTSGDRSVCLINSNERGAYWRIRPESDGHFGAWTVSELFFGVSPPKPLTDKESQDRNPQSVLRNDSDAWICETLTELQDPTDRWIGLGYGSDIQASPSRVSIKQWDKGSESTWIDQVRVECSNDGFREDVRIVAELTLCAPLNQLQSLELPKDHGQAASCWRVVALKRPTSGVWGVELLSFDTDADHGDAHGRDASNCAA